MMRLRLLFRENCIRSVANKDFTPELIGRAVNAIGKFFKRGRLILRCSGRPSAKGARISVKYDECR